MAVVVVTGAGSGIGRAVASLLHSRGDSVIAADLSVEELRPACDERFDVVRADVGRAEDNQHVVDVALRRFGAIDALVLNAGIALSGAIDEVSMDAYDRLMAVDLRGQVLGIRAALPSLRASVGPRSIVATASVSGLGGDPLMWAYNAAKAGLVNLVRALAMDLGPEGIRINAVCPGPTRTSITGPMLRDRPEVAEQLRQAIPLQRWGEPSEVAESVAFLLSPAASFITGVALPVDGGVSASSGQFRPRVRPQ